MPFQITNDPPSKKPFLKVSFKGLLMLRATKTKCQIGIHRKAAPHDLKITLKAIRPAGPVSEDLVKGHLSGKWFSIKVDSPTRPGVWGYQARSPFFRIKGSSDKDDLRWALNLEGDEFYRDVLSADSSKIHPGVEMNNGVFYSIELTDPAKLEIVRSLGSDEYGMHSIAGAVAAAIEVTPNSKILLEWKNGPVELPRSIDPTGTTYELRISNEPPPSHPPDPDELIHYHTALRDKNGNPIPSAKRWHLKVKVLKKKGKPGEGTDEIPCMPILGGGS